MQEQLVNESKTYRNRVSIYDDLNNRDYDWPVAAV
jgi:hypothetical protein